MSKWHVTLMDTKLIDQRAFDSHLKHETHTSGSDFAKKYFFLELVSGCQMGGTEQEMSWFTFMFLGTVSCGTIVMNVSDMRKA